MYDYANYKELINGYDIHEQYCILGMKRIIQTDL